MAVCEFCGFDGHVSNGNCSVCGAGEDTLVKDPADTPTVTPGRPSPSIQRATAELFRDRYRIEWPLGKGGMGTVYRAFDLQEGRVVALKILHGATEVENVSFSRFQREVRILRRLDHPLIPQISDAGLHDGKMFLVTELIEGDSLREIIARRAPFDPDEISRIGSFIAEGIQVAHENGVIHRDIKPHNVMMTREGDVRLLDFGIARDVTGGAKSITETGTLIGTPEYMSPEQFQGEKVDARTDIYSLGVVLFQMATAQLPFAAETPISLGIKHVSEQPVPPRSITPEVPVWLNSVILKCLEKRREDRYPTAGDLADDLKGRGRQRRHVKRLRNGDFLIEEDGAESWALVLASRTEKDWSDGQTVLMKGTYYRLELRELDERMPAPWVYRFSFWREGEVMRKLAEYDPDKSPETKKPSSIMSRLFRQR